MRNAMHARRLSKVPADKIKKPFDQAISQHRATDRADNGRSNAATDIQLNIGSNMKTSALLFYITAGGSSSYAFQSAAPAVGRAITSRASPLHETKVCSMCQCCSICLPLDLGLT